MTLHFESFVCLDMSQSLSKVLHGVAGCKQHADGVQQEQEQEQAQYLSRAPDELHGIRVLALRLLWHNPIPFLYISALYV